MLPEKCDTLFPRFFSLRAYIYGALGRHGKQARYEIFSWGFQSKFSISYICPSSE